jgi:hypothetical protein
VIKTATASLLFSAVVACSVFAGPRAEAGRVEGAVFEIAPPPAELGTNAAALRTAADAEIRKVDATLQRSHRRVVVSMSLTPNEGPRAVVGVNAAVRDARTGALLAIIETDARAEGPISLDQRKLLAFSAIKNAVLRVPAALASKAK